MLGIAIIARQRGQFPDALAHFEKAKLSHPKNSWVQIEIGRSLRDLTRLDDAETALRKVDPSDTHYRHVLSNLIEIARARGDTQATITLVKETAAHSPDPVTTLVNAANQALNHRDFATARAITQEIATSDPNSMHAAMIDGRIYRAEQNRAEAHAAFAIAAERAPHLAAPLIELAAECMALGQAETASAHLDAALALEPENIQALLQRAERHRATKEIAPALELLRRARASSPTSPWPYLNEAQLLASEGDLESACALIAEGRNVCTPAPVFAAREGGLLQEAGYLDRARAVFDEASATFPRDVWLWTSRVNLAIAMGDFKLAEQALIDPPASTPSDRARVLIVRARLAEAHWHIEDALRYLEEASSGDPANASAAQELVKLSLFNFDLAGAKRHLQTYAHLQSATANAAGRSPNFTQSQLGQIFDEFSIDARLVATVAALARQTDWQRLTGLTELVRRNPDSTATALGLLIGLRRMGTFADTNATDLSVGGAVAPSIPRVICQYWDGAVPPGDIRSMINSWIATHRDYRHQLFNDATALQYLRDHCTPDASKAFQRTRDRAQRADLFRMAYLYTHGGIYIDADDRCRGSLEQLLKPGKTLVVFQEDYGSIANNFIAVVPGHQIIRRALDRAVEAILRGDRDIVWLSTGPGMFSRSFTAALCEQATPLVQALVNIEVPDRHQVRRALVPYCQAGYKRSPRHWQNIAFPSAARVKTTGL